MKTKNKKLSITLIIEIIVLTIFIQTANAAISSNSPISSASSISPDVELTDSSDVSKSVDIGSVVILKENAVGFETSVGTGKSLIAPCGFYVVQQINNNSSATYPYAIAPLNSVSKLVTIGWVNANGIELYSKDNQYSLKANLDLKVRNAPNLEASISNTLKKNARVTVYDIQKANGRYWGVTYNKKYISMENLTLTNSVQQTEEYEEYVALYSVKIYSEPTTKTANLIDTVVKGTTINVRSIFWDEFGVKWFEISCEKSGYDMCYIAPYYVVAKKNIFVSAEENVSVYKDMNGTQVARTIKKGTQIIVDRDYDYIENNGFVKIFGRNEYISLSDFVVKQ